MRKLLLIATTATLLAGCANDDIIDKPDTPEAMSISFMFDQKNMTRADASLQSTGHYNFGVWAYKNTDTASPVMDNYLVGYMGTSKGYRFNTTSQTTLGDIPGSADGKSQWAYENLGKNQYKYNDNTSGYYTASQTAYMSNKDEQWLKYWDYSSASTEFYGYTPYINGTNTPTFASQKMTFPDAAIEAGYDDMAKYEFMYAYKKIDKDNYGKDVPLAFKRMVAKINLKFYEDLPGYSVKILDLGGNTSNDATGIQATPSKKTDTSYDRADQFYIKAGAVVDFSGDAPTLSVTGNTNSTSNLTFVTPTADAIGETATTATPSTTTYYGIPLGDGNTTGFTFHVSYQLQSLDTDEVITVNNATVYVPSTSVEWKPNTAYTYMFKITQNTTGTTDSSKPTADDYVNPVPNTDKALYPIVFDNCTVEDWIPSNTDSPIN